jgi:hypothetical protein
LLPIEVELTEKSPARLGAVLCQYASWIRAQQTPAVIYISGAREIADRVERAAQQVGLTERAGTIRIELLETIRRQAVQARAGSGAASAAA